MLAYRGVERNSETRVLTTCMRETMRNDGQRIKKKPWSRWCIQESDCDGKREFRIGEVKEFVHNRQEWKGESLYISLEESILAGNTALI